MKKIYLTLFALTAMLLSNINLMADDDCGTSLNIGTDIYSRYIFRGNDYGNSPSIQPTVSIKKCGFEIGYWGAISTNSSYKEIDLYAKYSFSNFSVILTDYYIPTLNDVATSSDTRYFNFEDKTTAHTLEAALAFQGEENFPIRAMAAVFFYGNDKRWGYDAKKDTDEETYYSAYVELGYTFKIKDNTLDVFLGLTPQAGAFGDTFGVVNLGVTGTKTLKISNDFELPVKGSVIYNPQASAVHYILGISL